MEYSVLKVSIKNCLKRDKEKKEIFLREWKRKKNKTKIIRTLKREFKINKKNKDCKSKNNKAKN